MACIRKRSLGPDRYRQIANEHGAKIPGNILMARERWPPRMHGCAPRALSIMEIHLLFIFHSVNFVWVCLFVRSVCTCVCVEVLVGFGCDCADFMSNCVRIEQQRNRSKLLQIAVLFKCNVCEYVCAQSTSIICAISPKPMQIPFINSILLVALVAFRISLALFVPW